jgi:restriction endonuclease S subunit
MLSRTASVGFSAIMGCDMATSQDFANWVCGQRLQPEFLLLVFRAMSNEFNRLKFGSTHNTIYMPDIRSFRMALPPIEEQSHIVATTQSRLSEMDDMIAEGIHIVELLQERRSALISAAVTGQIDVCSYQPRETRAVCQ